MMKKIFLLQFLYLFLLLMNNSATSAQERKITVPDQASEQRIALVFGNGAYNISPLKNPVNDARDIAQSLISFGFQVTVKENQNLIDMKREIRAFGDRIKNGGVGIFYFAGHGVQVNGRNYLIPIGAVIEKEEEIEYESLDLGFVLAQMESARNRMNIVILDACRNNPFARSFRSTNQGLAFVNAPSGTLIAYSTAPGSIASDGAGKNGIYTQELLSSMRISGLSLEEVFKQVRASVQTKTSGKQVPWESSSLVGNFYFSNPKEKSSEPADTKFLAITPARESAKKEAADFYKKGNDLFKERKFGDAFEAHAQATNLDPNNGEYFRALGETLLYLQRFDEAHTAYARAVRLDFNNIEGHAGLGDSLRALKKYAEAVQEYEYALRQDAKNFRAHEGLWFYYEDFLKDYDKALNEAQLLVELKPRSSRARHHLGATYSHLGRYQDCINTFQEALRLQPDFYSFYTWIVGSYLKLGKKEEAIKIANSLEKVSPSYYKILHDKIKAANK